MHDLHKILKSVTSVKKIKRADLEKTLSGNKDAKMVQLARHLHHRAGMTDEEAREKIYGDVTTTPKYRMLKSRLKNRMLNLLFLSDNDVSFKNKYYKNLFRLNRNILAAKFLILKDRRALAIPILKASLRNAMQHNLTREAAECCRELCYDAAYSGKKTAFARFQKTDKKLQRILAIENEMQQLFHSTLSAAGITAGYSKRSVEGIKNNFAKAKTVLRKNKSYSLLLYYHRIAYYYYHSQDRFGQVIKTCYDFIEYLDRHPLLYQDARYAEFGLYIMEACMRLRDFKKAKTFALHCAHHYIKFSTPWLQFHEYYFLLAMRTGNITDALSIHESMTSSNIFYKLPKNQKERWRIHEAFLNFALPDELPKKQFRLFRFLNEVPISNLDKPGYNFSILIAKIILLINIDDQSTLIGMENELEKYLMRYIGQSAHARHFYFGKMLWLLMKNNYRTENAQGRINFYFSKLKGIENKQLPMEESEIIPYEMLWEMLKKKTELFKPEIRLPEYLQ